MPNREGLATDYLWKEALSRPSLTDIIENYAQVVDEKNERTGQKRRVQIFPRYHQLDVVRRLLEAAKAQELGARYLIQHSAGSGKSIEVTDAARRPRLRDLGSRCVQYLEHRGRASQEYPRSVAGAAAARVSAGQLTYGSPPRGQGKCSQR